MQMIDIKPVSNWTTLAVEFKRAGCPNVSTFILAMMFQCIKVPAHEIPKIREAWRTAE